MFKILYQMLQGYQGEQVSVLKELNVQNKGKLITP